jgi:hypothetical protein
VDRILRQQKAQRDAIADAARKEASIGMPKPQLMTSSEKSLHRSHESKEGGLIEASSGDASEVSNPPLPERDQSGSSFMNSLQSWKSKVTSQVANQLPQTPSPAFTSTSGSSSKSSHSNARGATPLSSIGLRFDFLCLKYILTLN